MHSRCEGNMPVVSEQKGRKGERMKCGGMEDIHEVTF